MDQVKLEQIRILHKLSPSTYLLSLCVAVVISFVYWDLLPSRFVLSWVCVVIMTTVVRFLLGRFFLKNIERLDVDKWGVIYCIGTFIAGCNWGVFSLQFDSSWPPVYQLIWITLMAGLIAGAVASHACYFIALSCFYIPILLSVFWIAITQDDPAYIWVAPLLGLFWVIVHIAGQRFSGMLKDNIRMQKSLEAANEQLEMLSRMDSLTQLQNRGAMGDYFDDIWGKHLKMKSPVSVAMIDVDMFKAYNDHYGHVEGDHCLTCVAAVLRRVISEEVGFVGRYGGEEFITVFPGFTLSKTKQLMGKVREELSAKKIEHANSDVGGYLTVSIGVETVVPLLDDDWLELIDRADAKLYIAKQRGRDQIV